MNGNAAMNAIRTALAVSALLCSLVAGASVPLGVVSATGEASVFTGSVRVPVSAPQVLAAGDRVVTRGADSRATVTIDEVGVVQIGPESEVAFEWVEGSLTIAVALGGVRYALAPGRSVRFEAGDSTLVAGSAAAGLSPVALDGSRGAVAFDGREAFAVNQAGQLQALGPIGTGRAIPTGQLVAVQAGQIGGGGGGLSDLTLPGVIFAALVTGVIVGKGVGVIDDDDSPAPFADQDDGPASR